MTMTEEEDLLDKFRKLSEFNRQQVMRFVRELKVPVPPDQRKSLHGMFAHHATVPVTLEMIEEARREMWANFPREFPEGEKP
jgi:hypothetical protein